MKILIFYFNIFLLNFYLHRSCWIKILLKIAIEICSRLYEESELCYDVKIYFNISLVNLFTPVSVLVFHWTKNIASWNRCFSVSITTNKKYLLITLNTNTQNCVLIIILKKISQNNESLQFQNSNIPSNKIFVLLKNQQRNMRFEF